MASVQRIGDGSAVVLRPLVRRTARPSRLSSDHCGARRMDNGNWEVGFGSDNLDELLSGESSAMTLWFLAGYLKGLSDGGDLSSGERRMVLEPDGDGSWRLRSHAIASVGTVDLGAVPFSDHPAP